VDPLVTDTVENAKEETIMQFIPVSSSNIRAIGYDPVARILGIAFHSRALPYYFTNVPASIYREFMAAGSKGTFYQQRIKPYYRS